MLYCITLQRTPSIHFFPVYPSLWVSVVAVVGLVVHDEDVVDEVEAVRLGLEWRRHHLTHLLRVQLGELVYVLAATERGV